MLSFTIMAFFAKILQNLEKSLFFFLKIYFSPQKLLFLNFQNQDMLWGAQVICHWGCQWLIWMLPHDGFSFHLVSFTTCCIPATLVTFLLLLHLPSFTQHMPPCETCRLSGTVFQLHPETLWYQGPAFPHASDFALSFLSCYYNIIFAF